MWILSITPPPPKKRKGRLAAIFVTSFFAYLIQSKSWITKFVYFSKNVRRAAAFVTIDVDNSFKANGESWGFCPFWKEKKKWLAAFVTIYRANLI